jgi:hypothetical protein
MARGHRLTTRRRLPSLRRRELASDIASGLPGNEESSVSELSRNNMEAFGERDTEKRCRAIATICETDIA